MSDQYRTSPLALIRAATTAVTVPSPPRTVCGRCAEIPSRVEKRTLVGTKNDVRVGDTRRRGRRRCQRRSAERTPRTFGTLLPPYRVRFYRSRKPADWRGLLQLPGTSSGRFSSVIVRIYSRPFTRPWNCASTSVTDPYRVCGTRWVTGFDWDRHGHVSDSLTIKDTPDALRREMGNVYSAKIENKSPAVPLIRNVLEIFTCLRWWPPLAH